VTEKDAGKVSIELREQARAPASIARCFAVRTKEIL